MFDSLTKRLTTAFKNFSGKGRINENDVSEMLREVRIALLEADVNFQIAKDFIIKIREKALGADIFNGLSADQTIIKIVRDELLELLGVSETKFKWSSSPPTVILMCGLQGSGKTTSTAKLALWLIKQGKKPMLAACDTQRPAAITQLELLGKKIDVPVYSKHDATSPLQIAKEALERAKYLFKDVLIIDTAGRLSIDEPLMQELESIRNHTKPSEIFLVLDASTGQEAVNVAEAFHQKLAATGVVFTKLDGDTRGGAVLSVRAATQLPVRFIGLGEQIEALDLFYPDRMVQRILGMGDVLGLIERVEEVIEVEDAQKIKDIMRSGDFNFEDMLVQLSTVKKMGPVKNILKMLPGVNNMITDDMMSKVDEKDLVKVEAMINSMTFKERKNPDILKSSRKKRIAEGAGTTVEQVNLLIKRLEEMRKQMKQLLLLEKKYNIKRKRR